MFFFCTLCVSGRDFFPKRSRKLRTKGLQGCNLVRLPFFGTSRMETPDPCTHFIYDPVTFSWFFPQIYSTQLANQTETKPRMRVPRLLRHLSVYVSVNN